MATSFPVYNFHVIIVAFNKTKNSSYLNGVNLSCWHYKNWVANSGDSGTSCKTEDKKLLYVSVSTDFLVHVHCLLHFENLSLSLSTLILILIDYHAHMKSYIIHKLHCFLFVFIVEAFSPGDNSLWGISGRA